MTPQSRLLPCGHRLHLHHGPIDLIIGAEGPGDAQRLAFAAATDRFATVLTELVEELPLLRQVIRVGDPRPAGCIARRMDRATRPYAHGFITRMAAVAGSVADEVLDTMRQTTPLTRAYVNNGGDIALLLGPGQSFTSAVQRPDGFELARIQVAAHQGVGGIATSGRHGRSHSMGIADSVTVLARSAADADAAATLIANAVDLPDHPAITRTPAQILDPDSDLGKRPVVTRVGPLTRQDILTALTAGQKRANAMHDANQIIAAALCLNGEIQTVGPHFTHIQRSMADA